MNRSPSPRLRRLVAALAAVLPLLAVPASPATAHEVPARVTVQAFVQPDGDRLRLIVRAPLIAMRDLEAPTVGPGYLDFGRAEPVLRDAAQLWIADYVSLFADGEPLGRGEVVATRASLPSDRSFQRFEAALAHMSAPAPPVGTHLPWEQALLDVVIEYPLASADARIAIDPRWAHLGVETNTVLRFVPSAGEERVLQYTGDPGVVELDPRWYQSAMRFVVLGFEHILEGIDHLLFLLCLVIPFRRFGPLVPVVTAFTLAHSITLIASAMGLAPGALWFPPLVETLIALSILYMALENVAGARLQRRWAIAFGFGLIHGFGFSFLLRENLQFAGSHLLASLVAFNVGVELGQLLVLLLAIPALDLLFRHVVAERVGTIILSALVAHTAWHWMTERGSGLGEYSFQAPSMDTALLAVSLRWAMLALVAGGVSWALYGLVGRWERWTGTETARAEPLPGSGSARRRERRPVG